MKKQIVLLCTLFAMCVFGENSSDAEKNKSIEIGNAKDHFLLAERYANGNGIVKNMQEAVKWYRKAAEQGHAKAQYELGLCYANGNGVEKDDAEAKKWLSKAATRGYSKAKNMILAEQYRKEAERGNTVAQYELAICYAYGRGVLKDVSESQKWYRKAADQGHAGAQFQLGMMHYKGIGIDVNKPEAVKWFRKAAEQGYIDAQFQLGMMYYKGEGIDANKLEAMKWYRKAAKQGHVQARIKLELMSQKGKQDAAKWFRKAAEQGHGDAQFLLGVMYENGEGVAVNKHEAEKWYRKAAENGHVRALDRQVKHRQDMEIEAGKRDNEIRRWIFFLIAACAIFKTSWSSAEKRNGIRSLVLKIMAVLLFALMVSVPILTHYSNIRAEEHKRKLNKLREWTESEEARQILQHYRTE